MYEAYQVRPNDTIESIARTLGVAANIIREINGLAPNYRLTPGEVIVIPAAGQQAFGTYMVKAGDNMYNIAKSFNIPLDTLLQINGLNPDDYIYPNQELLVPKGNANVYTTKQGDTLDDVANALKINKQTIVEENEEIYLMPGQTFSTRSR